MIKLYPLFSGSSGNMYLICSNNTSILIDIGVSFKQATLALKDIGQEITNISALFITHEHIDHTRGLCTLLKKNTIPIYSTCKTIEYLKKEQLKKLTNISTFLFNEVEYEKSITISDLYITPFKVSHDAVMPVGYTISDGEKTVTIATDLGYINDDIFVHLEKSNLSVIESNYDPHLLQYGGYPYALKQRITSDIGHLSNADTSNIILNLAKCGRRNFILGHISENNNEPNIARLTVCDILTKNGFNLSDFNINVATRDFSSEVYTL